MYRGNCALKLDSSNEEVSSNIKIQSSVVDTWIKEHHDAEIIPFKMGDGDYVTGVCFTG